MDGPPVPTGQIPPDQLDLVGDGSARTGSEELLLGAAAARPATSGAAATPQRAAGPNLSGKAVLYEDFYGLSARPFRMAPDPTFLYWSEAHQMAFAVLRYGLMTRAPITLVTGEIGAGKTTLLRQLLSEMPEDLTVGLVTNMQAGRGPLLHWVCLAFDLPLTGDEPHVLLFRRFQDFLIERYAAGKRVVLMVDEAQNLSVELMEELRLLSNINTEEDELLQLVLVGQPGLRDLVQRPELIQFAQRVAADFHLASLTPRETVAYVHRRMQCAGARWKIFPDEVATHIGEVTGGVPRLINVLCDLCLVHGYADGRREIGLDLLREVLASNRRHGILGQLDRFGTSPKLVNTDDD